MSDHDGMPYGRNQGQGQGHSREVDRQSPTGLILVNVNGNYSALNVMVQNLQVAMLRLTQLFYY